MELENEKFAKEIHEIFVELEEIILDKNNRYGDSFGKTVEQYGLIAAIVRLTDKWNRLEYLFKMLYLENQTSDESKLQLQMAIEDVLKDISNYCVLTLQKIK